MGHSASASRRVGSSSRTVATTGCLGWTPRDLRIVSLLVSVCRSPPLVVVCSFVFSFCCVSLSLFIPFVAARRRVHRRRRYGRRGQQCSQHVRWRSIRFLLSSRDLLRSAGRHRLVRLPRSKHVGVRLARFPTPVGGVVPLGGSLANLSTRRLLPRM